jgi:hypothetical protein
MDTNTMILLISIVFAIVVIIGFIVYKRKAKVGIELPGGKLNFEGGNDTSSHLAKVRSSKGIFGNISIGKTRLESKGTGTIANNTSIGDTEIKQEDIGKSQDK